MDEEVTKNVRHLFILSVLNSSFCFLRSVNIVDLTPSPADEVGSFNQFFAAFGAVGAIERMAN